MENTINKIIRASAGTGKTYRLSLEFIGLLLKFKDQGIHFSEILVITFTKKATAEIRERIFRHLLDITTSTPDGKELVQNLESILHLEFTDSDLIYLKSIYQDMLRNKNKVQISTIDSFTNTIFKTIIAPYLGLQEYQIDNSQDEDLFADIFQTTLGKEENLKSFESFFLRSGRKKIQDYEKLISSILYNRWVFHFIKQTPKTMTTEFIKEQQTAGLMALETHYSKVLGIFKNYVQTEHPAKEICELLKKQTKELFFNNQDPATLDEFCNTLFKKIKDENFILENHKSLITLETFWNGSKLFRKKAEKDLLDELKNGMDNALNGAGQYLFYSELLKEENEILKIADLVLDRYDEIKFRDRRFAYNDISYYTFKYLYNPDLSLIDHDTVSNAFYEYLSTVIRFILIDEFQDTSIIQYKILWPIIKEVISGEGVRNYGGAILVGDEKQSIYGWRGGERDLLLNMPDILGHALHEVLNVSYRSDSNIISFINNIFSNPQLHQMFEENKINWPYDPIETVHDKKQGYIHTRFHNFSASGTDNDTPSTEEQAIREFINSDLIPLLNSNTINPAETVVLARKNSDLQRIAFILDESGFDYILESSNSIVEYRAIKPIFYLLNYFVYHDIIDFLKFLRSDIVLLHPDELKQILLYTRDTDGKNRSNILSAFSHLNAVKKVNELLDIYTSALAGASGSSIFILIKKIVETFNMGHIFSQENDLKNLNYFFEIISTFEKSSSEKDHSLKGFLEYCDKNKDNENLQQIGLETTNAINLLTIHKSKGLEFENVYLYINLSSTGGNETGKLEHYIKYAKDYSQFEKYLLTYNYDYLLDRTEEKELGEMQQNREYIEALNTFYVAVTRAKTNLFLGFSYKKSGGLEKLFEAASPENNPSAERLLAHVTFNNISQFGVWQVNEDDTHIGYIGTYKDQDYKEKDQSDKKLDFVPDFFQPDRERYLKTDVERIEQENYVDFKSLFLKKKSIDKGNIAHYYLSFLTYADDRERQEAKNQTTSYYGTLIPPQEITQLLDQINSFIDQNSDLFSSRWQVFTEYTIFSTTGRELRIDRLLIDQQKKQILIIDFKTGEHYQPEQLEEYKKAILALPMVRQEQYQVSAEFIEIKLELPHR